MFRTKGLSNYNLLGLIFSKSTATGVLHCASTQDPPNSDEENALEERLIHGGVHVNLDNPTQDPIMAILDTGITTRLSKRPSDSFNECKSKRELISSKMNDVLQLMAKATKARIETSEAKAKRYKRYTIDEVSSTTPTNDFSLGK